MKLRCHICGQECGAIEENEFFPFCSARCRLIDLGKWLSEEYSIPDGQSASIPDSEEE